MKMRLRPATVAKHPIYKGKCTNCGYPVIEIDLIYLTQNLGRGLIHVGSKGPKDRHFERVTERCHIHLASTRPTTNMPTT